MKTMLKEKKIFIPFVLILLVKIMFAGLFSSDYQNKMFEPFVLDFFRGLREGVFNPWQAYYESGKAIHFPYPIFMLLLSSIGGTWDLSIDDWTSVCDLLNVQIDDCDMDFQWMYCPLKDGETE